VFIRKIVVSNFMIHRRTELELAPMTVFVGPNNSGKSSLFDALLNLAGVCKDPLPAVFPPGPYSYRSRHCNASLSEEPIGFEVELAETAESENVLRYEIAYRQIDWKAGKAEYEITEEHLEERPSGQTLFDRRSGEIAEPVVGDLVDRQTSFFTALRKAYFERRLRREGLVGHVAENISRFGKFRLEPEILSKPGATPEVLAPSGRPLRAPRMRYRGEELASVLYFLDRTRDPKLDAIIEAVASAVDGFDGFEFNAIGSDAVGFSARFADSRGLVEAPNLSAGTLNLIGWLSLLIPTDRHPVLMLEEPELGLTPRSTKAVYDAALRAAQTTDDGTELLISSHSPSILAWAHSEYDGNNAYIMTPGDGACEVITYAERVEQGEFGVDLNRAMGVDMANQIMHGF
jgi:hypothetical protein